MENHSSYLPQVERLPISENELPDRQDVDMPQVGGDRQSTDSAFIRQSSDSTFNRSSSSAFSQSTASNFSQSASLTFNQTATFSQPANDQITGQINSVLSSIEPIVDNLIADSSLTSSPFKPLTEPVPAGTTNPPAETTTDSDLISCAQLADCLLWTDTNSPLYILIDSRSFIEYNSCHIQEALNVCCSKIIKRRLQNDKVSDSSSFSSQVLHL